MRFSEIKNSSKRVLKGSYPVSKGGALAISPSGWPEVARPPSLSLLLFVVHFILFGKVSS